LSSGRHEGPKREEAPQSLTRIYLLIKEETLGSHLSAVLTPPPCYIHPCAVRELSCTAMDDPLGQLCTQHCCVVSVEKEEAPKPGRG
jgi:hypothetical protein